MRSYLAEFIGTFVLALVVLVSVAGDFNGVITPILAALTLGIAVYTLGHVSGTHINPAVTIGLWSIGKIEAQAAGMYIAAQFLGAIAALGLGAALFGHLVGVGPDTHAGAVFAEMIGMALFTFGIASCVYAKTPSIMSGAVVGGSLLLGIALSAGLGSHGILNPAVALAIGSFNWIYLIGPIIGSVLGFTAYKYIAA
jgi:glycerol uptake facilitator-like aquaporin